MVKLRRLVSGRVTFTYADATRSLSVIVAVTPTGMGYSALAGALTTFEICGFTMSAPVVVVNTHAEAGDRAFPRSLLSIAGTVIQAPDIPIGERGRTRVILRAVVPYAQ